MFTVPQFLCQFRSIPALFHTASVYITMGNGPSNGHEDHQFDGCTTLGYRILGVQPDSPASRAGLVSFFDFLVGVNGQLLFDNGANSGEENGDNDEFFEDLDFVAILKDHVDKEIELRK